MLVNSKKNMYLCAQIPDENQNVLNNTPIKIISKDEKNFYYFDGMFMPIHLCATADCASG